MNIFVDVSNIVIESERLILRAFNRHDLDDFYEYASVVGVGEMAGWPHHKDMHETQRILDMFIKEKSTFAIYHKQDEKVIGSLGVHDSWTEYHDEYKHLKTKEIGYALSKDYWGRGLMPEAVQAFISYGFSNLGIEAFTCGHFVDNIQSKKVIEKTGFTFVTEGTVYTKQLGKVFKVSRYILIKDTKNTEKKKEKKELKKEI